MFLQKDHEIIMYYDMSDPAWIVKRGEASVSLLVASLYIRVMLFNQKRETDTDPRAAFPAVTPRW